MLFAADVCVYMWCCSFNLAQQRTQGHAAICLSLLRCGCAGCLHVPSLHAKGWACQGLTPVTCGIHPSNQAKASSNLRRSARHRRRIQTDCRKWFKLSHFCRLWRSQPTTCDDGISAFNRSGCCPAGARAQSSMA